MTRMAQGIRIDAVRVVAAGILGSIDDAQRFAVFAFVASPFDDVGERVPDFWLLRISVQPYPLNAVGPQPLLFV